MPTNKFLRLLQVLGVDYEYQKLYRKELVQIKGAKFIWKDVLLCRSALFWGHKYSLGPWLGFGFHNFQDLHLVCCTDLQPLNQPIPIKHHHFVQIHNYRRGVGTPAWSRSWFLSHHYCPFTYLKCHWCGIRKVAVPVLLQWDIGYLHVWCVSDDVVFFLNSVLENMCCQGSTVGGKFSELRGIIDKVRDQTRVGVCLDTCHAFAAGELHLLSGLLPNQLKANKVWREGIPSGLDIVVVKEQFASLDHNNLMVWICRLWSGC